MLTTYILLLEGDKIYVGITNNIDKRMQQHWDGYGSKWCKKYKPIKILKTIPECRKTDEITYTLEYMKKYGINNVRGGPWCQINISEDEICLLKKMIQSISNECYNCGKVGHFTNDCPNKKIKFKKEEESETNKKNQNKFNERLIEITKQNSIQNALSDMKFIVSDSEGTKKCLCGRNVKHKHYYESKSTKMIIIAGSGCRLKIDNLTPLVMRNIHQNFFDRLINTFNYTQNDDNTFPPLDKYCLENIKDILKYYQDISNSIDNFESIHNYILELHQLYLYTQDKRFKKLINIFRGKKPKPIKLSMEVNLIDYIRKKFRDKKSRQYFDVKFSDKEYIKKIGGLWDSDINKWYLMKEGDNYGAIIKFPIIKLEIDVKLIDIVKYFVYNNYFKILKKNCFEIFLTKCIKEKKEYQLNLEKLEKEELKSIKREEEQKAKKESEHLRKLEEEKCNCLNCKTGNHKNCMSIWRKVGGVIEEDEDVDSEEVDSEDNEESNIGVGERRKELEIKLSKMRLLLNDFSSKGKQYYEIKQEIDYIIKLLSIMKDSDKKKEGIFQYFHKL
jgi:predicted GIY-YIG superfamily endonuclease